MSAIGYARVSTRDQDPALQLDALWKVGVDDVLEEVASGVRSRPVLTALLARLKEGDTLAVWKLDRLGRNAHDIILILDDLRKRGVAFRSVTEGFDTDTPAGRAFLSMMAVMAQMERELTLERVSAGIAISRAEGRHGRPRKWDIAQTRHALDLIYEGHSIRSAARLTGIPKSTLSEALDHPEKYSPRPVGPGSS